MSAIAEPKLSTDAPRRRGRPRAAVRHERSPHARDWLEYLALRAAFAALAAVPLAVALRAGEFAALGASADPLIGRWLTALRVRAGTRAIRKRHAARAVLAALHEHGFLVLPFDQNSTRGLGVFVDFFGEAASTNAGIARIALRTDAPIVPIFIVRDGRRARHTVHVLPIMQVERTGDDQADVVRNTQRFSDVFEDMVRRYPEQWLWMHKRWKTRPAGAPRLY